MFFSEDLLEEIVLDKDNTGPNKENDEARHEHQVHQTRHHMSVIDTAIRKNGLHAVNQPRKSETPVKFNILSALYSLDLARNAINKNCYCQERHGIENKLAVG